MEQGNFNTASVQPGPPVYELSGWWRRVGAELIDLTIILIIARVLLAILEIASGITMVETDTGVRSEFNGGHLALTLLVRLTISTIVMAGVMGYSNGQTVGMMACGIRVVREGGETIGYGFAFKRETLVKTILFGYIAALTLWVATILNYLWPLWDDKNQALHDKICSTRVVLTKSTESIAPIAAAPVVASGPPQPAVPDTYQAPQGFENPVPEDRD